jgi:hypothetical protein
LDLIVVLLEPLVDCRRHSHANNIDDVHLGQLESSLGRRERGEKRNQKESDDDVKKKLRLTYCDLMQSTHSGRDRVGVLECSSCHRESLEVARLASTSSKLWHRRDAHH